MSQEPGQSDEEERKTLPIEKGFPVERLNEIAEKEARAKQWYRPIYTMHKWWARRLGSVFRSIFLYTFLDNPDEVTVHDSGDGISLSEFTDDVEDVETLVKNVDMTDPASLWSLYNKDVQIENKRILDPFMGGGTTLVEASRFGVSPWVSISIRLLGLSSRNNSTLERLNLKSSGRHSKRLMTVLASRSENTTAHSARTMTT